MAGRKDSRFASQEASNKIMPSPRANATYLIQIFQRFNLSIQNLVALSGSHSFGYGRGFSIVFFRIYNQSGSGHPDPTINPALREMLDKLCPLGGDENITGGLDATPVVFHNQYFKDLLSGKGFLNSDQVLFSTNDRTRRWVVKFSWEQDKFFSSFVEGMIKVGSLPPATTDGEVRRNCRRVNKPVDEAFLESSTSNNVNDMRNHIKGHAQARPLEAEAVGQESMENLT